MTIKHRGVLSLLGKQYEDAPTAKMFGIAHLDDRNLTISSEGDILLIIPATDALVKNDHDRAHFHANTLNTHVWAVFNEPAFRH